MSKLLTMRELAAKLSISYDFCRKLINEDEKKLPPYIKIGNVRRWLETTVDDWTKEQQSQAKCS